MRAMRDYERVVVIRDALMLVKQCSSYGKDEFERSEKLQLAIAKNIIVIAENISMLSKKTKRSFPAIDWNKVDNMCVFVGNNAQSLDPEIIWLCIEQDVPVLYDEMQTIISASDTEPQL